MENQITIREAITENDVALFWAPSGRDCAPPGMHQILHTQP